MKMKTVRWNGFQKELSRLVYGTGAAPMNGTDKDAAWQCLDRAWQYGFRAFDSAHAYGFAEENLGDWLALRGYREQAFIIDKGCNPGMHGSLDEFSAETVRRQVAESLAKLRTDYIDCYILHRDDPEKDLAAVAEALDGLQREGKIRAFGVSNWTEARIDEWNDYAARRGLFGVAAYSPCFGYAVFQNDIWGGSVRLSGKDQSDFRARLRREGMPIFAYSALGRGYLSGKFRTDGHRPIEECLSAYPIAEYDCAENRERLRRLEQIADGTGYSVPQIALSWLLSQGENVFPIVSPTSEKHIAEAAESLSVRLSPKEVAYLDEV